MTVDPSSLDPWGLANARVSPIAERENAVFRVDCATGKFAFRLHRQGYHDRAEIRSELIWMLALSERGFPVPKPIPTRSGELVHQLSDGRLATMISWVNGSPVGAADIGFDPAISDAVGLQRKIGILLAELHNHSDAITLPEDFTRPSWNRTALLGPEPLWGNFIGLPTIERHENDIILAARDQAADILAAYEANADYGLIHADALRENIFFEGDGLTLIDFDDSGYGFRLYDLAVALSQSLEAENYLSLRDALLGGYASKRPLDETAVSLFPLFAMCRAFASLGWAQTRLEPGNPSAKAYERRAVIAAKRFLGQ